MVAKVEGTSQCLALVSSDWLKEAKGLIYHLKFEDFFDFTTTRSTRVNHQYKLYVKPARLNCYIHSFFVRIVKLWNELPGDIVEADSFQFLNLNLNCI